MLKICALILTVIVNGAYSRVDYTGHKVLSATPQNIWQLELVRRLRSDYDVDLWNEPRQLNRSILFHLKPQLIRPVEKLLEENNIKYEVTFNDLESAILDEMIMRAPTNVSRSAPFDFGKYNDYDTIINLLKNLVTTHPKLAKLESIGHTYENRDIFNLIISSGKSGDKPAIMMDCGIHPREWSSIAAGAYFVNRLLTTYDSDPVVKSLVDKYEFHVILLSNPDGYIYTIKEDRLWRKTRSRSMLDWLGVCLGADANRNFDVDHCGLGTSRKPCEEDYCGDKPFSESEARALRDLMIKLGSRLKAYFSLHAYGQLWMSPYGTSKKLPPNYDELERVGKAGTKALAEKYGTEFEFGTISNVIYEATGSSVDYAYQKLGVKIAYAIELRDRGRHAFILPKKKILPMCEETFDGLQAAILALK